MTFLVYPRGLLSIHKGAYSIGGGGDDADMTLSAGGRYHCTATAFSREVWRSPSFRCAKTDRLNTCVSYPPSLYACLWLPPSDRVEAGCKEDD